MADRIKGVLIDGFIPFAEFLYRIERSATLLSKRAKAYGRLQAENTELRKEKAELSTQVMEVSELQRKYDNLQKMLDFKKDSELKLIPARVVARDPSNWSNTMLVDRGSDDGIQRDMPVLTVDGLVGKTLEVTKNNARVILIIDENCKVSGWLRESARYGIVQGNALAGGVASQCRMTFLDRSAEIKPNDRVYTSGLGTARDLEAVFPRGIFIGTVQLPSTTRDPAKNSLYQEVEIAPAVDLARIDEVFIGIGVEAKAANKPARPAQKKESNNPSP